MPSGTGTWEQRRWPGTDAVAPFCFRPTHSGKGLDRFMKPVCVAENWARSCPADLLSILRNGLQGGRVNVSVFVFIALVFGLQRPFSTFRPGSKQVILCFYKFGSKVPNPVSIYFKKRKAPLRAVPPTGSAGNGSFNVADLCWKPVLCGKLTVRNLFKGSLSN